MLMKKPSLFCSASCLPLASAGLVISNQSTGWQRCFLNGLLKRMTPLVIRLYNKCEKMRLDHESFIQPASVTFEFL